MAIQLLKQRAGLMLAICATVLLSNALPLHADTCTVGSPLSGGTRCSSNVIKNVGNGYSYQYWSNGTGSAIMTIYGVDAAFKTTWTEVGNYLGRVGLGFNPAKTYDQMGPISADFAFTKVQTKSGGLAYIGIYGWTLDTLHEYYIIDDWFGSRPTYAGTKLATITVDSALYDVMTHTMVNQPSINGKNETFVQFWSLRQVPRQCGHISVSEHFAKWDSLGIRLGKVLETRVLLEAMNNSGTVDFTRASVVVGTATQSVLPGSSRSPRRLAVMGNGRGVHSLVSLNGKVVRSMRMNGSSPVSAMAGNLPGGVYINQFQEAGKAPVTQRVLLK